jgi:tetrahydromethanopterin S-methyltransferase subunit G
MTAQQHTIQRRMVETIDRQLAGGDDSYILRMGPKKLRMVRSFVLSFILERGDRVIPYMDFPEPEGVEPVALGDKPSGIEALAERLAKVEQHIGEQAINVNRRVDEVNQRIDKVAEIIGERVSGLVDRMTAIENGDAQDYDNARKRLDWLTEQVEALNPGVRAPAFPTGGAHTADAATEAVLPVPQRGDRVRLEGASGEVSGRRIKDGWYDVVGWSSNQIQIRVMTDQNGHPTIDWLPWLSLGNPAIKEVRHADHT